MWYVYRPDDAERKYAHFMKVRSKVKVTEVKMSKSYNTSNSLTLHYRSLIFGIWIDHVMLNSHMQKIWRSGQRSRSQSAFSKL